MTVENLPHPNSSPHAAHAKDRVNISPSPASGGGLGWGQKTVANYGNINKYLLIGLALIVAAAGGAALKPTRHIADQGPKIDLETMIPKQFEEWKIDATIHPLLADPKQTAVINKIYNQTLSRTYVNSRGERIMLSIAYGGDHHVSTYKRGMGGIM